MVKKDFFKHPYLPPRVVTVTFKVEDVFVSGFETMLIPSSSNRGVETYGTAANEGSFWDSDLSSTSQTETYGSSGWSWN